MAGRLDNVEIFATGRHQGSSEVIISGRDLDDMVESFNNLSGEDGFKPVLKLGHEDAQKYFGQKKGSPNLGFVEKIWREGEKVLANFANVPDAVVDLISKGRYNSVSIEMYPRAEYEGKVFSNVLTAVALLGAELPAVKGLKELAASLFSEKFEGDILVLTKFDEGDMPATYTKEQLDELVAAAVAKVKDSAKAEFDAKVSDADVKVAEALKAKKAAEAALKEFEQSAREREAASIIDGAIKEGKLVPAQRDMALAFALSLGGKVKFGDEEKASSELFKQFIEAMPAKVDFSEVGAGESNKDGTLTAAEEVDKRSRELSKKEGITYFDARRQVLEANADLKQRYFDLED